jgi:hypothetical protein
MGYVNTYTSAVDYLGNTSTQLAFKGFVMDTNGGISKVVDNGFGVTYVTSVPFGSSRIRGAASDNTDSIAFLSGDVITQRISSCGNRTIYEISQLCNCEYVSGALN